MKRVKDGFQHDNTVLVASETSPKPHVVKEYKNGKFSCDDMCPAFNHSSLCAHTLAAAEHKQGYASRSSTMAQEKCYIDKCDQHVHLRP